MYCYMNNNVMVDKDKFFRMLNDTNFGVDTPNYSNTAIIPNRQEHNRIVRQVMDMFNACTESQVRMPYSSNNTNS